MENARKKRLNADLMIALLPMAAVLALVMACGQNAVLAPVKDAPLLVRVLYTAFVQFSIAGLGAVLVMAVRREGFSAFGLKREGALKSVLSGLLLAALFVLYAYVKEGSLWYLPFRQVWLTEEALAAPFPVNVLSMLLIACAWGFFEGFNYVFFSNKINALIPIRIPFLRLGPIVMGVACIFIHGAVGQDMLTMLDAFLVVYLSLLIPELTGSAWGTILVFFLYWNAV